MSNWERLHCQRSIRTIALFRSFFIQIIFIEFKTIPRMLSTTDWITNLSYTSYQNLHSIWNFQISNLLYDIIVRCKQIHSQNCFLLLYVYRICKYIIYMMCIFENRPSILTDNSDVTTIDCYGNDVHNENFSLLVTHIRKTIAKLHKEKIISHIVCDYLCYWCLVYCLHKEYYENMERKI